MSWKKLLENKSLEQKKVSPREVERVLSKAYQYLKAAELLLAKGVDESVFKEAYDAIILASRALMFSLGLKPRSVGAHRRLAQGIKLSIGPK
jgi:uncharacterized protein (UPF0332 family)